MSKEPQLHVSTCSTCTRRERGGGRERDSECVCVCACVCVFEREREKERERESQRARAYTRRHLDFAAQQSAIAVTRCCINPKSVAAAALGGAGGGEGGRGGSRGCKRRRGVTGGNSLALSFTVDTLLKGDEGRRGSGGVGEGVTPAIRAISRSSSRKNSRYRNETSIEGSPPCHELSNISHELSNISHQLSNINQCSRTQHMHCTVSLEMHTVSLEMQRPRSPHIKQTLKTTNAEK